MIEEKIANSLRLNEKLELLTESRASLEAQFQGDPKNESLKDEINTVQDDLDFIRALTNNCLNGPINPLLSVLASKSMVSHKLQVVFGELLKNGLALPQQMIFFNKSNALLEGILLNISQTLDERSISYNFKDPDEIFSETVKTILKK